MSKHPFDGLSVRAWNALTQMGYSTKQGVRAGVKNRDIHPSSRKAINIGIKTFNEIRAWLGMKIPTGPAKIYEWRCAAANIVYQRSGSFEDTARVMRLKSKEEARQLVARYARNVRNYRCGKMT